MFTASSTLLGKSVLDLIYKCVSRYVLALLKFNIHCYSKFNRRGTIYILSLIVKNSNLSSKMALFFFKVFSFMIYTFLHTFQPCVIAFFSFRSRHLQNMVLSNYVRSNENKSFSGLNFHAIFYICWWN